MSRAFLILHGLANHRPPDHWQHWLAGELRTAGERVLYPQLPEPDAPSYDAWRATLDALLVELDGERERVVVCHSLACLLWLRVAADRAADAPPLAERLLLVAPPASAQVPDEGGDLRLARLDGAAARRSVVAQIRLACSDADAYDPDGADRTYGAVLDADVDRIAGAGHLNPDSGYGPWPSLLAWCFDPAERLRANR